MKEKLEQIKAEAVALIQAADATEKLNDVRVKYLGRKGELTAVLKGMKDVAPEDRPKVGQMVNDTRAEIEALLDETKTKMERAIREQKLKEEVIDVTLPSRKNIIGHRHPNTIALEEVERIFVGMGYEVVEGPEVEYDEYNFEKLNIPADHPAKDEQDTFYINKEIVLRTQTSPVQARVMEQGKLPIRMIAPGRVFRSDEVDATHSPSFHQIEGLVIDKNISFADLKGTLEVFAKELFGPETKTKFRPHHFPFTEPSAEVDVSCFKCGGKGCRFCKGSGWIEILGCGMVHPHVLEIVLRTQTSPVQARVMEQGKLPIRMIAPGRVFRSDEVDATHSPSFHQIEGLVIDKNISFADLKGTLEVFAKELFGPETKTKFRPHHFPFTEPSAEVDVSCFKCGGKGCRFCKGSGWIEILGCGMVHPHVLEMCGIDPEEYTGFAFGVGLERIALLKYEIDDMRLLYENDIRFLNQF